VSIADTSIQPVVKTAVVQCSVQHAFDVFTAGIATWWPVESHSVAAMTEASDQTVAELVLECRQGGRFYEVTSGGHEHPWGTVVAWEPPHRLVIAWKVNPDALAATEIDVRFAAEGTDRTGVRLEHRGWELLADPAGQRTGYNAGWDVVLGRYLGSLG
jgi:uncharacterized protein YndB with AHSA1/START domain